MNKKLFATLLLIPMLIFVADQVMGNVGPEGGKDKKKKKHNTEAQAAKPAEQAAIVSQEAEVAPENSVMATGVAHTEAQKMAILKTYFNKLEDGSEDFWTENMIYSGDEVIPAKTRNFLNKKLLSKVEKIDPAELGDPDEWFSRCPSGYRYYIDGTEDEKPLASGVMCQDRGCNTVSMGKFEYDVETGTIVMLLPQDLGKVSVEEYFSLRKIVMG